MVNCLKLICIFIQFRKVEQILILHFLKLYLVIQVSFTLTSTTKSNFFNGMPCFILINFIITHEVELKFD